MAKHGKGKDCDERQEKIMEDAMQKLVDLIGAITKDFAVRVDQDTIDIEIMEQLVQWTETSVEASLSFGIKQMEMHNKIIDIIKISERDGRHAPFVEFLCWVRRAIVQREELITSIAAEHATSSTCIAAEHAKRILTGDETTACYKKWLKIF